MRVPLQLVLEVRRVDQDQLPVRERQLDLLGVGVDLVARDAVQADLADAEHGRPVEELRDALQHLARQLAVVRFLRVHRHPGVVLDAVLRGALRLELGELAEVVLEAVGVAAVPAGPERRLGDRDAARQRHLLVVVGRARHHVRVMIDVLHDAPGSCVSSGRRRRARSCGRARRAASLADRSGAAGCESSRPPVSPSAASASANAFIRKSRAAYAGVGAIEPIEERRDLEQRVRFSMKYSSTSSFGLSGRAGGDVAAMGVLTFASVSGAVRVLEIAEHADAPDHNVAADLVHVERARRSSAASGSSACRRGAPGTRPARAARSTGDPDPSSVLAELGHVDRQPERRQQREDAPPVVLRQEARPDTSRSLSSAMPIATASPWPSR